MVEYQSQIHEILEAGRVHLSTIKPSEWTEKNVMMGKPFPGPFRYDKTPYTREIIDCVAPDHPAKIIAVKKRSKKFKIKINHYTTMKLKATDLMICDWVFSQETQSYQQITSISEEYVTINAVTFDYTTYDEIEPIPLTPELLEKCGFKQVAYKIPRYTFKHINNYYCVCLHSYSSISFWINEEKVIAINYLHQLQQLIRLLTKQELIINL
jgi:hypothetical protein